MTRLALAGLLCALPLTALADIRVEFREGAPKDRFVITNTGACLHENVALTIDLTGTAGKLIFDTTGSGAGVEVFQPFVVEEGAALLAALPDVTDGQTELTLRITQLAPGAALVATTDLDDTIGQREITVANSELSGAVLSVTSGAARGSATFTDSATTAALPC